MYCVLYSLDQLLAGVRFPVGGGMGIRRAKTKLVFKM